MIVREGLETMAKSRTINELVGVREQVQKPWGISITQRSFTDG